MNPLIKQYQKIKAKYKDALLLFRIGDFYEVFDDDAAAAEKVFGDQYRRIKNEEGLTTGVSIPNYALDTALHKLVRAGYKVGICDQLEDPKRNPKQEKRSVSDLL